MEDEKCLPDWRHVRDLSDAELKKFIDLNDMIDPHLLAKVCSEILRRERKVNG